ncbi:52 kDa repressor of the inhibitor of the protein kinase-like [Onthophagus taurus]|uniref:52 kDa repressor of the inhibitor of the protein kinase-like n=1 Tax=Onthophagus taurus TaxID=166361 RepID=UPI0039BE3AD3
MLDVKRLEQIKINRDKIKSIISTVHFLGKQNISLRGHRVYSDVVETSDVNEGNLREFIRHRIETCGDDLILKNHFETASVRNKYISPTIQNQLINCCGDEILNSTIEKIKKSKYYSIIFDETTDISHKSQMSLIVRYVDENCKICGDFLGFLDCHQENYDFTHEPLLTGKILGQTVIAFVNRICLPVHNCVGIGTDTCSVMLSDTKGAVSEIRETLINAIASPCYNHSLNLSISKATNVQAIRNTMGTIKETIAFFNSSAKGTKLLSSSIPNN